MAALVLLAACPGVLVASPEADRRIEAAARASYNLHVVLEDAVAVKADAGVVTLTGVVGDGDFRVLAEQTVGHLPGVSRVDDRITVDPALAPRSDRWIAARIRAQLLVRCLVDAATTRVQVRNGVVTLTGTANNQAQKDLTGQYAKEVDGVTSVVNDIVLNAAPVPFRDRGEGNDDASISAQAEYLLLTNRATRGVGATVTTVDGCILITGRAGTDAERALAGRLCGSLRGVMSLTNDMTVGQ